MAISHPLQPFIFILFLQIFISPVFADNYTNVDYRNNSNTNIANIPLPSPSLQQTRPGSSLFKPSTALFIFLAVLLVLFCIIFLLLLYSKRCGNYNDNNPFSYASALVPVVSAGRNSGVNQVVVESLPLFRFSSLRGQKDGLECAVCLARFEPNELLRLLPKCKHAFHAECVDTWLDAHSTCPLCRYRVEPEDILLIQDQDLTTISHSHSPSSSNQFENTESEPYRTRRVSGRHSYAAGERTGSRTTSCCRKDGLLLVREDERKKRLEHRIIVSGSGVGEGSGSGFHQRWSDVQPSDLLYLRSEMIISQSGRLEVGSMAEGRNNNKKTGRDENGNGTEKNGSEAERHR